MLTFRPTLSSMESFWVIVPRGETERYLTLSRAYMRRREYTVILDRRSGKDRRIAYRGGPERRLRRQPPLEPFEIVARSSSEP